MKSYTNLGEELLQSMEYSDVYTKKERRADRITFLVAVVLVLAVVFLFTN